MTPLIAVNYRRYAYVYAAVLAFSYPARKYHFLLGRLSEMALVKVS